MAYLKQREIYSVATGRTNRLPDYESQSEKKMKRYGRGSTLEHTVAFEQDNEKKDIACPDIVKEYNKQMSGVDLQDSLLGLYPIKMKSKKWYHRIFCHMLNVVEVNAWL